MNPLISVIVPIYNVEKYLRKCIESIINQSYKNIEIILVNDGSTDNCEEICNYYKGIDHRIVFVNKKNGGLSSARNAGLNVAKGRYISFVDSDDWIEIEMIEEMVNIAIIESADVVQCGIKKVLENGTVEKLVCNIDENYTNNKSIMDAYFNEKISVTVWNKLYDSNIVKNIKMVEGKNHEDNMYSIEVFLKAQKVVCIENCCYNYLQRNNSITKMPFKLKKLDGIYAGKYVLSMCENYNTKYTNHAKISLCLICYYLYYDLLSSKNNEKRKYKKMIRNEFYENYNYIKSSDEIKNISLKNKLKIYSFAKVKIVSLLIYELHLLVRTIKLNFR